MVNAPAIKTVPAKATNIESILDIILQILSVIEAISRVFGINFDFFGGTSS